MWYASLRVMPTEASSSPSLAFRDALYGTEKATINAARKLRVAEIDRLTAEVNQLDERYDEIEDAEVKGEQPQ